MKANLILFNTEEGQEDVFNTFCPAIQQKLNVCTVETTETTVFSDITSIKEKLKKQLENFTIIAWDFGNVGFDFDEINNVLNQSYGVQPLAWESGWYYKGKGAVCLVIDTSRPNFAESIIPSVICNIFDISVPCAYVKIFGLEKSEIRKLFNLIPNEEQFNCTIYTKYLVGELSISTNTNLPKEYINDFLRNLYLQYENYWFSDNEETLVQKLDEICSLRNARICISDGLTKGEFEKYLREWLVDFDKNISKFFNVTTLEDYARVLHIRPDFLATHEKYSVDMAYEMSACLMEQGIGDIAISLCGNEKVCFISVGDTQAIHVFKYVFNHKADYIYKIISRQAVFKILKKLRENHLYFLENNV